MPVVTKISMTFRNKKNKKTVIQKTTRIIVKEGTNDKVLQKVRAMLLSQRLGNFETVWVSARFRLASGEKVWRTIIGRDTITNIREKLAL